MTTHMRIEPLRRLSALLVLLAGVLGAPVGLWRLGRAYLPDELPSWAQVSASLSSPDTGAVLLGLLVLVGWVAWAAFTLSVAVELTAQLRGLPSLRLPGLATPQQVAGLLIAAVIGLTSGSVLAAPALAAPTVAMPLPTQEPLPTPTPVPTPETRPTASPAAGLTYTVQPRDTLGRIAARQLGDWSRFEEILDLNRGRPQPDGGALTDPALIRPGWILVLPTDAPGAARPAAGRVVVEPGDTLTGIAQEHGLDAWRPIFDLNAGEPQPGGGNFTDPDLLRPGQVLDLPPTEPSPAEPPAVEPAPSPPAPPSEDGESTPQLDGPQPPAPIPSADPVPEDQGPAPTVEPDTSDTGAQQSSSTLATVLSGSGALLAAGVAAAWLAHRRQRLRSRRPGRRLTPLPADLAAAEAVVAAAGAVGQADYQALDRALRELAVLISADPDTRLPDIVAARLGGVHLQLRLPEAGVKPPPAPWTVDDTGLWWSLKLDEPTGVDPDEAGARLAPYPTLVTIGADNQWRWLLDLEHFGDLTIAGPASRRENLARHIAAELAVNSWSDLLTVTTVGFGEELADLAPDRLSVADASAFVALRAELTDGGTDDADVLQGRLRAAEGDGWMPHVVLAPYLDAALGEQNRSGRALAADRCRRGSVALVTADPEASSDDDLGVTLTEDGIVLIPALGLRLPAPQLNVQEAVDIAALLAFERDTSDQAVPAAEGDRPWQVHTDSGGALCADAALSATATPDQTEGQLSQREDRSAATQASELSPGQSTDVVVADAADGPTLLAPSSALALRRTIEADLDQLDRDLRDWWNPDCQRPRLTLLGPVTLRALGDEKAVTRSGLRRRYEEAVAYLATRPHGATVDEAATALQPARRGKTDDVSARAYVHRITAGARAWLGVDPDTGEKHLSSGHRGPYTLTNVLVDADLFRQLRARAGVRGRDGMADLISALKLVSGQPFAQRPTGYEWLDGLDFTLTAAICDVAHQVVTAALGEGNLEAARAGATTALRVAPDDEKVLLDAMQVAFSEGNRAEAEAHIARVVVVHSGEDEMDLPLSTAEAISRARRLFLDRAS
ncbi:LysM peptidoglycan-binding domain-containing protein [Blastococcus sp. URHD0036]|uniref:LysM peptidoglycan-binding domain-containing protein n=1 Tax=Blastococcus sp. URHD0036 TaxID=1380356 RepID=UPI000496BF1B|nr:LysM peptidoglycan-binding domain-containing protein [Blastococcus sp. URHD0036]